MSGAADAADKAYPEPGLRRLITITLMAATVMAALDSTIANVALPHIQGSISASQDEMTWVLTSYIVASAICIPLTGWLANRVGRKPVLLVSIAGFTFASMLCGIAGSLPEIVAFRVLQGAFGAALIPISQAVLLDINPPERHGQAMAVWGMGAIVGPVIGPVLGGWLTDNLTWRWVFYVNVPFGILGFLGLWTLLKEHGPLSKARLDVLGFLLLSCGIAGLQIMLDRGQQQDWFSSPEICVEAALTVFCFYSFVVHTATAQAPFIDIGVFADRNFVVACVFGFVFGVLLFSTLALLPTMLQQLMGYPVVLTGLVTAPRGAGTLISMAFVGGLIRRVDARVLMIGGFSLTAFAMWQMASFSLQMDSRLVVASGVIAGVGNGMIFTPLSTMAFSTLSSRFRNEAASMYNLIRSLGSAVGISLVQTMNYRNASAVHARLVQNLRPDNPVLALRQPGVDLGSAASAAALNGEATRQATMVAYVDSYWALFVVILAIAPLILLMRPQRLDPGGARIHAHEH